jgi:uncharacterized surface protein with fasciclin (FAS1) repeats
MRYIKYLAIIMLAAFAFAACSSEESSEEDMMNEDQEMQSDAPGNNSMAGAETIVSIASANPDLSTLVKAVKAAGRAEMLSSEGPFTVFAPTNEAFSALPEGALDDLLKPENKQQLANVLAFHVVEGSTMAADLQDGQMIETVQGDQLEVTIDGETVMIIGAEVIQPDVEASNGVVHVIGEVLMPSN